MNAVLIKEPQIPEVGLKVKSREITFSMENTYTSSTYTISQLGFTPLFLSIGIVRSSSSYREYGLNGMFPLGPVSSRTTNYDIPEVSDSGNNRTAITEISVTNSSSGIQFSIDRAWSQRVNMKAVILGITLTQ